MYRQKNESELLYDQYQIQSVQSSSETATNKQDCITNNYTNIKQRFYSINKNGTAKVLYLECEKTRMKIKTQAKNLSNQSSSKHRYLKHAIDNSTIHASYIKSKPPMITCRGIQERNIKAWRIYSDRLQVGTLMLISLVQPIHTSRTRIFAQSIQT